MIYMNNMDQQVIQTFYQTQIDNRMFDVLGRELTEVPIGVMYIQNRKIYIRK